MKLLSIAALATAASASPFAVRQVGGVLLCTGANATGTCKYHVYPLDQCQQLQPPFYQNTSTFAVDGEAFACSPRLVGCGAICTSPTGCTFGAVDFAYAHKWDLGAIGWEGLIASFDCHLKGERN